LIINFLLLARILLFFIFRNILIVRFVVQVIQNCLIFLLLHIDWYSIGEKVCNSIFIFRAISLTLVGKPQCFLPFLPCLHMALSYQTVSKTIKIPGFPFLHFRLKWCSLTKNRSCLAILGEISWKRSTYRLKFEHGQLGKCLRNSLIRQCHM
jgi:hypothetical protein